MKRGPQLHRWLPVLSVVAGSVIVWVNLDSPRFIAWYFEALEKLGYAALLSLFGVAIWSLASGGGRTRR